VRLEGAAGRDVEITGLSADSRTIQPGALFAALAGSRTDGRLFRSSACPWCSTRSRAAGSP
jgi:UDP-N-acetylmuramoyl-L-alanyl-D-glutamate--2,6-diaminopimelate ligase